MGQRNTEQECHNISKIGCSSFFSKVLVGAPRSVSLFDFLFQSGSMESIWLIIVFICMQATQILSFVPVAELTKYTGACDSGNYYDTTSLRCKSCSDIDDYAELDLSDVNFAGEALGCKCLQGFTQASNDCSSDQAGSCSAFSCSECTREASYIDRSACVPCHPYGTAGFYAVDSVPSYLPEYNRTCLPLQDATSNSYYVLYDSDSFGNLNEYMNSSVCPSGSGVITVTKSMAGKTFTQDPYSCQSCPDSHMEMSFLSNGEADACTCKSGYIIAGLTLVGEQYCVKTTLGSAYVTGAASESSIPFYLDGSASPTYIASKTVQHYYPYAATNCLNYRKGDADSARACQLLANLCSLAHYDSTTGPCEMFDTVESARSTNVIDDIQTWHAGLPWLNYQDSDSEDICFDEEYQQRMKYTELHLEYVLSKYTLNGTWLGYEYLNTAFSYCTMDAPDTNDGGGTSSSSSWQVFGHSQSVSLKCDLENLVDTEQYFYELFLTDSNSKLYPVPVRLTEYTKSRAKFPISETTQDLCDLEDVLFRRFFLYDIVSGVTVDSDSFAEPQYIRYAKSISMEVRIKAPDDPSYIYAPVLTITYEATARDSYLSTSAQVVDYDFFMRYTQDMTEFYIILDGFFIAASTIFGLMCLVRGHNYVQRNTRAVIDPSQMNTGYMPGGNFRTFREANAILLHSWVLMFVPFTILLCWYYFLFFKLQATVAIMLPPQVDIYSYESPYYIFTTVIHVLFFFQLAWVSNIIYKQCVADIFFVDWEQSKKGSKTVSVWRSILCINEWNEMQTMRRTSIIFTLFWIGYFLLGADLEYNATQQPDITDKSPGELNVVLRFANTTWWWLLGTFCQLFWNWAIYERYITEPPEQRFIDMCTIAKISLLVLIEPYYGFYLHCRSPHQYADGSMAELVEMMHQEEAGLTVDRSLEGAPANVQAFELFVSAEWRVYFDKIYQHFKQSYSPMDSVSRITTNIKNGSAKRGANASKETQEGNLKAHAELTSFMKDFVDNNFQRVSLRRRIYEPSYIEKIVKIPPVMSMGEQPCTMISDLNWSFTKTTFLGCEYDLIVLNILAYSTFDLWFDSTATSILLTYLLELLICAVRSQLGAAYLSRKTMLDERFLM